MDFLFTHWQCYLFLRAIEEWDVSGITDMKELFRAKANCNPPIGNWNVSQVTNFVSQSIASMHVRFYLFMSKTTKQGLTPFFWCSSNIIATTPNFNNNVAPLLMLSQNGMFYQASAFNADISTWNVSSGEYFVSGMVGLWKSWSSRCFHLLSSDHCLCCCRPWRDAVLFMHSAL